MNSRSAIQTASGLYFDAMKPSVEDVRIGDIVHALSQICRFSGHTRVFWSVADHSLLVADLVHEIDDASEIELHALLHEAPEAYLLDLPTPLKYATDIGEQYRQIEGVVSATIADALGLPRGYDKRACIKLADRWALAIEASHLMPPAPWITDLVRDLHVDYIVPRFADRFDESRRSISATRTALLERIEGVKRRLDLTKSPVTRVA